MSSIKSSKLYSEKFSEAQADADMDLMYAQYLQMIFLESEAKKAMELRSQNAMETFQKLYYLIMQHFSTIKSETLSLQVQSIFVQICEHISKQDALLKPLLDAIPSLAKKYENLAKAVSIMKNKLYVKNIEVPEPGNESEVSALLEDMQAFLSAFFEQGPQYRAVVSTADAFQDYVQSCRVLTDELKNGLVLMLEVRSAAISEASRSLKTNE